MYRQGHSIPARRRPRHPQRALLGTPSLAVSLGPGIQEVKQVKQKLGGLRFYVSHRTDAILQRIQIGESESLRICEVCDKPGKLRDDCIRTVCDEHARL
jgi:hypothetical protein